MDLLSPVRINALVLKNRVVLPPMTMNYAEDGCAGERDMAFHAARAAGGCGLNMVDGMLVESAGYGMRLALDDDRFIAPLHRLVRAVHDNGGRLGVQLLHHGRCAPPGLGISRERLVSLVPGLTPDRPELVMDATAMRLVREKFVQAALRAKRAGVDLVELSACHGYLLAQFLSPLTNRRQDAYGGSLENRLRYPREIIAAVRHALGPDYPLSVRISIDEMYPGGLTLETTVDMARMLAESGIDLLSLSASIRESYEYGMPPACVVPGWLTAKAGAVRAALNGKIPVMVSGRILSYAQAQRILDRGEADLVGMGRALLAAPERVGAFARGREQDCPTCLGCNIGCVENLNHNRPVSCTINPCAGREHLRLLAPARAPRHIVIVGAGPAGMTAAIFAARKGHGVTLLEAKDRVGGKLPIVGRPPHKGAYAAWGRHLEAQIRELSIDLRTGVEADLPLIDALHPDLVILATGSRPVRPGFLQGAETLTAEEALAAGDVPGKTVAILGGGAVGAETAEFFASRGHAVTLVELRNEIAPDMEWRTRKFLLQRLESAGVTLLPNTRITAIAGRNIRVADARGRERQLEAQDALIVAMGYQPHDPLSARLADAGHEVRRIGDCNGPGLVLSATAQALEAVAAL